MKAISLLIVGIIAVAFIACVVLLIAGWLSERVQYRNQQRESEKYFRQ